MKKLAILTEADDKPTVKAQVYTKGGNDSTVILEFTDDKHYDALFSEMNSKLDSHVEGMAYHKGFPRDTVMIKLKSWGSWKSIQHWVSSYVKVSSVTNQETY